MDSAFLVQQELSRLANPQKAKLLSSFFKTAPGQYGEGDIFLGIPVPLQRKIAQANISRTSLRDLDALLASPVHEHRLTALLILVGQFAQAQKANDEAACARLFDFYLAHTSRVNNWDLVDLTAPRIAGVYLFDKKKQRKKILDQLSNSGNLWERRIAIVSTLYSITQGEYGDTLWLSQRMLGDGEDLIHKAVGWMLREVGKRDEKRLERFLALHASRMPRTALRYAIERLPKKKRQFYLGR